MLTRKHKARLRAYIVELKRSGKFSPADISDLAKKKARDFNPATEADIDNLLSEEGLPPSDGDKIYFIED